MILMIQSWCEAFMFISINNIRIAVTGIIEPDEVH